MVCLGCVVSVDGEDFVVNIMVIQIEPFNVILGMDWLHCYRAVIFCFWRTVTLQAPSGEEITFQGNAPLCSLFVSASLFPSRRTVKSGSLLALAKKTSASLRIGDIVTP